MLAPSLIALVNTAVVVGAQINKNTVVETIAAFNPDISYLLAKWYAIAIATNSPINAIVILYGSRKAVALAWAQLYQPINRSLITPQSGKLFGVNGGVEIIKQKPPKIDNGIATTIPSRIAAKWRWFPSLLAIGTKVLLAISLNFSIKFIF